VLLMVVSVALVLLVVGKVFVVPQLRNVARTAKRPALGVLGVALIGVMFAGMAVMPFLREYRLIELVSYLIGGLAVAGAALLALSGKQPRRE
jgi:H+/gluconate symporter-like permease